MPDKIQIPAETLNQAARQILQSHGVPDEDAEAAADALMRADLRGVDTHGVACLPGYADCLRENRINARPEMRVERRMPCVSVLDADNGLGPVAATRAMELALEAAEAMGVGVTAIRRSNHFGAAGVYAMMAAEKGCIGMVMANALAVAAPFGAAAPFLGTNPLAVAVPAGRHPAFVLDMATAEGSRKKVRRALAEGQQIPSGWALGPDGRPTTDPAAALEGVMLPFGGLKGSGIGLLTDILSGVLSGAEFGGRVLSVMTNQERESGNGHFMLALKTSAFLPEAEFRSRMDEEIDRLKALPPASGFASVSYPGEREAHAIRDRSTAGIPLSASLIEELKSLGARCLP
mgnify:CR=1 FL=1